MRQATSKVSSINQQDALSLLKEDHQKVEKLFKQFEKLTKSDSDDGKAELAQQICNELTLHAALEEEIFYPAVRAALNEEDQDLLDEAEVEHSTVKNLIAQIESMEPGDDLYDARVTVLGEYVRHHVEEEEGEMFPKAKKAKVDLVGIGEELAAVKQELGENATKKPTKSSSKSKPRGSR